MKKSGSGGYTSVRLVPVNEDYDEVMLINNGRNLRKYRIVGVWRSKIKAKSCP